MLPAGLPVHATPYPRFGGYRSRRSGMRSAGGAKRASQRPWGEHMPGTRVVLDTNVFVAAGFNRRSSSAQIIRGIEQGRFELVWDQATRRETERIVRQIPRLSWQAFAPLFRKEAEYTEEIAPGQFLNVEDPDDRKFAALSAASGSILITNDDHLIAPRSILDIEIRTPTEFLARRESTFPSRG